MAGTLAGALICAPIPSLQAEASPTPGAEPAQMQRQSAVMLGVVQGQDNLPYWQELVIRLEATDVTYRVIDWQQVQQASDLAQVNVLLLPNITTISSQQLLALEAWMGQGGRVIASGPVGTSSSYGVQQALRALLGGQWATALSRPAAVQMVAPLSQPWTRQGELSSRVLGGIIQPNGAAGQTVLTWKDVPPQDLSDKPELDQLDALSAPAMVITERTTFLGWYWGAGNAGSAGFDSAWLRAVLTRYSTTYSNLMTATDTLATPTAPGSSRPPAAAAPVATSPLSRPAPTPPSGSARTPAPAPVRPAPSLARPPIAPRPAPTAPSAAISSPSRLSPAAPTPLPASQDPAEQVAPAGLPVELNSMPITTMEAIAMRQELESLIGRFESALLSSNSINSSTALERVAQVVPPAGEPPSATLVASIKESLPELNIASADSSTTNPVISEARQIAGEFPQLITARDYATARQQWLYARQLLWDNFPTDRPQVQPEIRAMWLDRGTIVRAGSRRELAVIFDRLSEAGINTVFFETVNAGYPIYPSRVAPQQNPLVRGWDPLEAAVDLAHERGMELHAWVWAFAAGNSAHNTIVNLPADYPGPILSAHPDWANYDNRGSAIPPGQGKPFLDPANPAVRRYLLQLFEEIVSRYDVDGLQLDYIRYPFQDPSAGRTYGYGLASRQQFQRITGVDPATLSPIVSATATPEERQRQRQLWDRWTEFRTEQINSFVADTARMLERQRPEAVLSAAVFALSEHERIQKIQQNWEEWARRGDVDLIVTMSYAMDTNRLLRLAGPWIAEDADLGAALVVPGIRLLNLPDSAILDQIQALRDMPTSGYALFAVENLNENLQAIFSRTQGMAQASNPDPIPYRQPFAAAASRYAALQREWSYMLSNGDLWMREPQLEQLRTQADQMSEALNQLADRPSRQQAQRARQLLQQFRARFGDWMYLQSLNQSYRIRTWENRLAMIDALLDYGEQATLDRGRPRTAQVQSMQSQGTASQAAPAQAAQSQSVDP